MKKKKSSSKEQIEKAQDKLLYGPVDIFSKRYPKLGKYVIYLIAFFVTYSFVLKPIGDLIIKTIDTSLNSKNEDKIPTPFPTVVLGRSEEGSLEKRIYDEKNQGRCDGAVLSIVDDLVEVGGERFNHPVSEDYYVVEVQKNKLYQGSYKTLWECNLPYSLKTIMIPISSESLGFFIEVENLYRLIIGDGDMRYIKLERNDSGHRGSWGKVFREKLLSEIESKKTVTVILGTEISDGWVNVDIEIYHSARATADVYSARFMPLTLNPLEKNYAVRVGVNDFRYKGEGSLVRLETLSITETAD